MSLLALSFRGLHPLTSIFLTLGVMVVVGWTSPAHASCDVIPGELSIFPSGLGETNTPYAAPDQLFQVRVRPQVCDVASPGLGNPASGGCADPADLRATFLFFDQSLSAGPPQAVVLARECGEASDPTSAAFAAQNLVGVSGAECRSVGSDALNVVAASATGGAECRLNLRLPATPNPALDPDFTLSGPARIFVDNGGAALPADLASTRCADLPVVGQLACVDELYELNGTCDRSEANRGEVFSHFVALPRPNVYAEMISADPTDRPTVRFALDDRGNVLANVNWEGVLYQGGNSEVFPPPQLVNFFAKIGSGRPGIPGALLTAPEAKVFSSYNSQGIRLPPLFEPRPDQTESVTLFGSTDALVGVIRVERFAGQCIDSGTACLTNAGCSDASSCDLSSPQPLFDLRYCISAQGCVPPDGSPEIPPVPASGPGGPGAILASNYTAEVDGFVPLENLNVCRNVSDVNCLLRDESLPVRFSDAGSAALSTEQLCPVDPNPGDGRDALCADRNADGDILDVALTLREARSGQKLSLPPGMAEGTAVAAIHEAVPPEGPFGLPNDSRSSRNALASGPSAAGGGCVAILLAEPDEGGIDANGDGEVFDPLLRVYCPDGNGGVIQAAVDPNGATEKLAVVANPKVLGAGRTLSPLQAGLEPLVVAGGKVIFLLDEPGNAVSLGERADVLDISLGGGASVGSSGRSAIGASGRVVCFESTAQLVDSRDKNKAGPDVYCHDFETGETFVGNRFQEPPSRRALCDGRIIRANADAQRPSVVGSGERVRVCYDSPASNLSKGDQNKARDVFLLDRCTCETVMLSVDVDGSQLVDDSFSCDLAEAGHIAVFASGGQIFSQGIIGSAPETCGVGPEDSNALRTTGLTLVSAGAPGVASAPTIADDGAVAFQIEDGGVTAVYLSDGAGAPAECIDVDGVEGCDVARNPRLSADGRLLTYEAFDPRPGAEGVFVLDRVTGLSEAVGALAGASFDGEAVAASVVYTSEVGPSVTLRDRVTLLAKTVEAGQVTSEPSLSADGRTLAYTRDGAVFRATPDLLDASADADADGFSDSTVLAILDLDGGGLEVIGRATQVAAGDSTIAYLDPNGLVFVIGLGGPLELDGNPVVGGAVAASDDVVCVLAAADGSLSCALSGSTSLVDFGVQADGLAVQGDLIVALGKPASPRTLWMFGTDGVGIASVPGVRRFRVSTNQYVAADQCEPDLASDLNGDGDQDECVAVMVAPDGTIFDTANPFIGRPRLTVVPCTGDVCDDTDPFKIFPFGTDGSLAKMRLLSLESQEPALVADLNGDGDADDVVVREVAFGVELPFDPVGVPEGSTGNVLAGAETGPGGSQGGAAVPALLGRCDASGDGLADTNNSCQSDANCDAQGVCGGTPCCVDIQPRVLALSDLDGDGVFDVFDNCPSLFNPEQDAADADGDGVPNTCDELSCGDGVVQEREYCDYADTTVDPTTGQTLGSFCNGPADPGTDCTPLVLIEVSESAVNPDKSGILPTRVLGSPVLNLGTTSSGDRPPKMLDPGSLILEGIGAGENCGGLGAPSIDDLTDPEKYATRLVDANDDGFVDLGLRFSVTDMQVSLADVAACLTGSFSNTPARFFEADFETRDDLNVK